ncbi:hypothetical protein [Alloprevotella tannerae]|uniref:hypothetical protein n=1 Tax=Alloprevotella tannerae TaxID=76122 RepID=UPI0028EF1A65|nr:hypothetical protein [Alloprevotella tannerae]
MRSKASLRSKVYFNRRPAYHHWIIGESHAYLRTPDCFVHRLVGANDGLAAANDGLVGANDGLATANEQTLNSNKR